MSFISIISLTNILSLLINSFHQITDNLKMTPNMIPLEYISVFLNLLQMKNHENDTDDLFPLFILAYVK